LKDSQRRIDREVVGCRACPRLVAHREEVARVKRRAYRDADYWGRPVPAFGTTRARLVLVGLAPGAHGSNRTGRMFTGDSSGDTLFAALHAHGFASRPAATGRRDGLRLHDCFITAAVRCAPPGNKPSAEELAACRPYLLRELRLLTRARIYLALGKLAFDALLKALPWVNLTASGAGPAAAVRPRFVHGAAYPLRAAGGAYPLRAAGGASCERWLLCSYHPSRQNTQTGRLTAQMFDAVFARARAELTSAGFLSGDG